MLTIAKIKILSFEEFHKYTGYDEEVYNALRNSKRGYISITKQSDNPNFYIKQGETKSGLTQAFGEGLSLSISNDDEWFKTSNIIKINWEDETFETLNSKYSFKFKENGKDLS